VTAALARPRLERLPEGSAFAVDIARSGEASVYGDILPSMRGPAKVEFREPLEKGGALIASVDAVL
jgi:hypothetical protein